MSAEDHVSKMRKYFDLLFGKQMDELLALFSDDIDWFVVPTNTRIKGKGQFRAMAENHWAASPDRTKKFINLFADDEFACLEYTTGGTLKGEADFVTREGRTNWPKIRFAMLLCFPLQRERSNRQGSRIF